MSLIEIKLPDGSKKSFPENVNAFEVAASIGEGLSKSAIAVKIDGVLKDLFLPIKKSAEIEIVTTSSKEALDILRHTSAHVMAEAIVQLWPGTKLAIGPTIEKGFYYDVDSEHIFTPEDLPVIEKKMKEIISLKEKIKRSEIKSLDAISHFKNLNDPYKVELIEDLLKGDSPPSFVSTYKQGEFEDLCRGPHLPNTGFIKAFKLTGIAGAYFRGDERRKMLQRIYGTAFFSKKDLSKHLEEIEEAKKRDHRVLGKELNLFSFHKEAPGAVFFHDRGTYIYNKLVSYIRNILRDQNYEEIMTPQVLDVELWKKSGHYENYKEAMYFVKTDEKLSALKPMNCPGHLLVYKTHKRSYRDLPLKLAELGTVHRHEKSGVTHGLMRVRKFTQDDAHIFCREDQIELEVTLLIKTILKMYKDFSFDRVDVRLSTRPEKSIGSNEVWEKAQSALTEAIKKAGVSFSIDKSGGAFYGPKIDFDVFDALGRPWQLGTIQLDFSMPERFNLEFTAEDGKEYRPVMIHRAVYGALERFMGVLIEHYGGNFPLWLAPLQARIISISEKQVDYARKVYENLKRGGFRVELDIRNQKLGYKIREAELQKSPYMLIIGENEVLNKIVSVRSRVNKTQENMSLEVFTEKLAGESVMKGGC